GTQAGSLAPTTCASWSPRSTTLGGRSSRVALRSSQIVNRKQYVIHSRRTSSSRPGVGNVTSAAYVTGLRRNEAHHLSEAGLTHGEAAAAELRKSYVKHSKNDANDAAAICEAVTRPSMRFVATKSEQKQSGLMLHHSRQLLVCQRTMLSTAPDQCCMK